MRKVLKGQPFIIPEDIELNSVSDLVAWRTYKLKKPLTLKGGTTYMASGDENGLCIAEVLGYDKDDNLILGKKWKRKVEVVIPEQTK